MAKKTEIEAELQLVTDLKGLLETYEEIAVMRMQRTRDSVLVTRDFMTGLTAVFRDVRSSYQRKLEQMMKKQRKKTQKRLTTKKGRVSVFLSADARLSGGITRNVFRAFLDDLKENPGDVFIVGTVGRELWEAARPGEDYTYFDLPNNHPDLTDMDELVQQLLPYNNAEIWYGQFVNLVSQRPASASLSSDSPTVEATGQNISHAHDDDEDKIYFLFEPALEKVVEFFNQQIFSSLVLQTAHESELALLGSRAKAMEDASDSVDSRLHQLTLDKRTERRRLRNRKQRERLAGIALWG